MAYLKVTHGKDFDLSYYSAYGYGVETKIKYGDVVRELSQETYDIIEKKMIEAGETGTERNGMPVFNITHDEVKGYYLNELPPVDVVATKPTSAAAGSNAKILLLVVGVAAALILFNK